jgi:4a-hydroxytetrahydrobiopterin dehydratase
MASELTDHKCIPCAGGTPPLSGEQIAPLLAQLDGWQAEANKKLVKSYRFRNFVQAVDFVNAVTPVAEQEGHHPDLYVRWGEVRVYLWTHKIDGLTESDFVMAAKIDRVAGARQQNAQHAGEGAASRGRRRRSRP